LNGERGEETNRTGKNLRGKTFGTARERDDGKEKCLKKKNSWNGEGKRRRERKMLKKEKHLERRGKETTGKKNA